MQIRKQSVGSDWASATRASESAVDQSLSELMANERQQKRFYPTNSPKWRRLREQVLREEPFCRCGCGGVSVEVDHIDGRCETKHDYRRDNLQGMTKECHAAKTAVENGSFGRRRGTACRAGYDASGTPLDRNHYWKRS